MFSIEIAAFVAVCLLAAILLFMTGRYVAARPRRPWMPLGLAIGVMMFLPFSAYAQETVAQAAGETTRVTWAWGAIVSQWASAILQGALAVLAVCFTWLGRKLPEQVFAILVSLRAEQFLQKAIEYGINSVANASKDKKLEFDVGNAVLAKALQYILDSAPGWLVSWLGGPDAIAQKIWARLDLDPSSTDKNVQIAPLSAG